MIRLGNRWRALGLQLSLFFMVIGPGLITANVDNDAGGITTYSQAGAQFGYDTLWIFLPMTLILILVQEMANRMGVVTGKGLSSLIREEFGVRWAFFLMAGILLTNLGNILAEFAGIAASMEIFGIPRFVSVPLFALFVWLMVIGGTYKSIEKIFLVACLFYVSYIITGFIIHPPLGKVATALVTPVFQSNKAYVMMLVGIIGTTIAPWMQFYQQASVAEKNIPIERLGLSRLDTILGCIAVNVVALFIVIVCAETLFTHGIVIETAAQAAESLAPLAGKYSAMLFALGLANASLFAASILPLSTSYTICEAFGWETGLDKRFREAKVFYGLYTLLILLGATVILWPGFPLIKIMLLSQVVNGAVLPIVLVFMLILIRNPRVMGQHRTRRGMMILSWSVTAVLSALVAFYLYTLLFW